MTIKEGDVVQLNSGGPLLTVARLFPESDNGPSAKCIWFVEGELKSDHFVQATLKVRNDVNR